MNNNLRCIIIDDEIHGLDYIRMLCSQIQGIEIVKCFVDPKLFLSEASELNYDVCLLDIQMPELTGLQLAQLVSDKFLIFISAHKEFAADAFDINAVDFIRKPASKERLERALNKARELIKNTQTAKGYYAFNTQQGKSILYFDDIWFIRTHETEKRDKEVFLSNGLILTLKNITLDNLMEILPSGKFAQVNKREIISIKAVQYINQNDIILKLHSNNKPIEVILSEVYKQEFLRLLES
jgi:DNA-binding LytR/AlgR family response regulator